MDRTRGSCNHLYILAHLIRQSRVCGIWNRPHRWRFRHHQSLDVNFLLPKSMIYCERRPRPWSGVVGVRRLAGTGLAAVSCGGRSVAEGSEGDSVNYWSTLRSPRMAASAQHQPRPSPRRPWPAAPPTWRQTTTARHQVRQGHTHENRRSSLLNKQYKELANSNIN
jgi:hypothetical protein